MDYTSSVAARAAYYTTSYYADLAAYNIVGYNLYTGDTQENEFLRMTDCIENNVKYEI